ncbi:Gfo/Idh/MocA family protein [Enterococcus nangangensis]|uniref:Gfo/Idh/MocA family protein n=1 Tax=Enterococcus nangangensis TaxID=2559926 RepID=UPI0010F6B92F|nr:Gfo/Idh/MocA family oxidoreductase [Enterococcus nangangensis]
MLRLAVIGTHWISQDFVTAAHLTEKYQLTSVYSRKEATGKSFAAAFPEQAIVVYTDWQKFLKAPDIDVVYIASPNSLHFPQARDCLSHGKNVIVEKPAFVTAKEMQTIVELASQKHCFYFEAARHLHEPGFQKVKEILTPAPEILGARLSYAKYSSRYDAYLNGEEPNIFSAKFAGGALMDLGVYGLYCAVSWFGFPQNALYYPQKLASGVDGSGLAILRYPGFDVSLAVGKNYDSFQTSEIYTTTGTITLPTITGITAIDTYQRSSQRRTTLSIPLRQQGMYYEALHFATMMLAPEDPQLGAAYEELLALSIQVNQLLCQLRQSGQIILGPDKEQAR